VKIMKRLFYLPVVFLFLFFGCYGLQTTSDCTSMTNPEEKMDCYHQVAMLRAYIPDQTGAKAACENIYNFVHSSYEGSSLERKAETLRNKCYFDIAKILAVKGAANPNGICDQITEKPASGLLFGSSVTSAMCDEQVDRLKELNPEEYYDPDNDNICSSVVLAFIIPFSFLFFRLVHNL